MGYYTKHTLKTKNQEHFGLIKSELETISEYGSSLFEERVTWYECGTDCLVVSAKYPSIAFAIHGSGENQGDVWQKTYEGGQLIDDWKARLTSAPEL